ncbi:hypothetical protein [Neisseria weaveri]|uniref:hypothetical protein n=1 Tax=Neisseria weaveri TaxID=28091 RepID=UPI0007C9B27B|nr:hypothetical protein [Neisseria weaveri]SAY50289.1 Uncharacterised protein [Neisseria weaveri]
MGSHQSDTSQDKITYQMGLNLQKYQEIEQIFKRIIYISSKTLYLQQPANQEVKPQVDIWSNRSDLKKATLGNLLIQFERTSNEPKHQEHVDEPELIQISCSYHIPAIIFVDKEKFELDFKEVVKDRNRFIHSPSMENDHNITLSRLKKEYERAEQFKQNHLIPCLNEVIKNIDIGLEEITKHLQIYALNYGRLAACEFFDEIYQKHKRSDGWAVWQNVIQEMQKKHPNVLSDLRKETSFTYKKIAWVKIIKEAYPNWQFMEEETLKGSKQLVVKVDNSSLNLREE